MDITLLVFSALDEHVDLVAHFYGVEAVELGRGDNAFGFAADVD